MKTFEEYEALATNLPASLRNNRDRVQVPVLGLQEEAGKIGSLFSTAFSSGKLILTSGQTSEIKDRLSDLLWYIALLCGETKIRMSDVAENSLANLKVRFNEIDPEKR